MGATTTNTTQDGQTLDHPCMALDDRGGQCGRRGSAVVIDGHSYDLCEMDRG